MCDNLVISGECECVARLLHSSLSQFSCQSPISIVDEKVFSSVFCMLMLKFSHQMCEPQKITAAHACAGP